MKNRIKTFVFIILSGLFLASCDSYLDVVPDNIATIDNAFTDRIQAEKFLYGLYSYLPLAGHVQQDQGRFDDLTWAGRTVIFQGPTPYPLYVLRDGNRATAPYCNNWEGLQGGIALFQAIRDCNLFLEKIDQPRDLYPFERIRWVGEAKFLKAYYHFLLLQQYGPIPIIDVNLPVSASDESVMVERLPVDIVFDYIIGLLDEAASVLPLKIEDIAIEMGRITMCTALAVKAKVAVAAASPLFNGNTTYSSFTNRQGQPFFSDYSHEKWAKAVVACKEAIEFCHDAEHGLYEYAGETDMSPETKKIVQVGRIITDKWNKEHIWGIAWRTGGGTGAGLDSWTLAALSTDHNAFVRGVINPTMKAAEMFYSKNGVPIEEDKFYDYDNRYETVLTSADDSKFVQTGIQTAGLHLNREYRFYGSMAFDGGWWYGIGRYNEDNQWPVNARSGQISGQRGLERYSCTSFFIKKFVSMLCSFNSINFVYIRSNYPIFRMADLYLLYAEALNEYLDAPNGDVWEYVNLVRERAGLESVQNAWTNYSKYPDKYTSKSDMRDIIRRERSIELMFEGHRLFDLRRWDLSTTELTGPVRGWNYLENAVDDFYQVITVDNVLYTDRDIFTPIRTSELAKNSNLIQNPGW